MLMDSIDNLELWLSDAGTDVIIADMIVCYLKGMGRISMTDILHRYHDGNQAYLQLATYHDKLGWDNFVEGRILVLYVDMMRNHYFVHPSRYENAEWWAKDRVRRLHSITHQQWLHLNANVHIKKRDGKTQVQHERLWTRFVILFRTYVYLARGICHLNMTATSSWLLEITHGQLQADVLAVMKHVISIMPCPGV